MQEHLTPRQVARAIGVSDASLKRWCDRGLLPFVRTVGGHRRLPLHGVLRYLRESGHPIVRPEILGLPSTTSIGRTVTGRAAEQLQFALERGDGEQFQRLVFDLYLAGARLRDICDRMISPALRAIGVGWEHGRIDIHQERRGCEICTRALHSLLGLLPPALPDAPLAIGGGIDGDPYTLPTLMVEVALRELGWRAESLGPNLPLSSHAEAARRLQPRLIWLSLSIAPIEAEFAAGFAELLRTAETTGAEVVIGGRELSEAWRDRLPAAAHCSTLDDLAAFITAREAPIAPTAPDAA